MFPPHVGRVFNVPMIPRPIPRSSLQECSGVSSINRLGGPSYEKPLRRQFPAGHTATPKLRLASGQHGLIEVPIAVDHSLHGELSPDPGLAGLSESLAFLGMFEQKMEASGEFGAVS